MLFENVTIAKSPTNFQLRFINIVQDATVFPFSLAPVRY